jgi:hypothetical protein
MTKPREEEWSRGDAVSRLLAYFTREAARCRELAERSYGDVQRYRTEKAAHYEREAQRMQQALDKP